MTVRVLSRDDRRSVAACDRHGEPRAARRRVTRADDAARLAELLAIVAPPACVACRAPLARADELLCAGVPARAAVAARLALPALRACPATGRGGCPAAAAAFDARVGADGLRRDARGRSCRR